MDKVLFLYALLISAEDASETISKLAELHDRNTAWAEHLGRSKKRRCFYSAI